MTDTAATKLRAQAREMLAAADCFDAVAALLKALGPDPHTNPPIVEVAQALLPLGLCIIHRGVVENALHLASNEVDEELHDSDDMWRHRNELQSALDAHAEQPETRIL